jgi:hypothetical protein
LIVKQRAACMVRCVCRAASHALPTERNRRVHAIRTEPDAWIPRKGF